MIYELRAYNKMYKETPDPTDFNMVTPWMGIDKAEYLFSVFELCEAKQLPVAAFKKDDRFAIFAKLDLIDWDVFLAFYKVYKNGGVFEI